MSDNAGESQKPRLENEVAGFRQPMVTSLGIILGFLLAFLANWAADADETPAVWSDSDYLIFLTLALSIGLFTAVLFRVLDNRIYPAPGERYRFTLLLYMAAIMIAFAGLAGALLI